MVHSLGKSFSERSSEDDYRVKCQFVVKRSLEMKRVSDKNRNGGEKNKNKTQMAAQSPHPPTIKKKKWASWCLKGEREDSPEEENEQKGEKKEKWWQVIFHLSLSWQQMLFPILLGHAADPI